ncbi:hypothetical protein [Pseudoxanthomonas suwonensis]|nr:hypothetical protein [Pseudoxanthomonas suwonensis]
MSMTCASARNFLPPRQARARAATGTTTITTTTGITRPVRSVVFV